MTRIELTTTGVGVDRGGPWGSHIVTSRIVGVSGGQSDTNPHFLSLVVQIVVDLRSTVYSVGKSTD